MQISYNYTKQKVKGVSDLENNDLFEEYGTEGTDKNNAKNKGGVWYFSKSSRDSRKDNDDCWLCMWLLADFTLLNSFQISCPASVCDLRS